MPLAAASPSPDRPDPDALAVAYADQLAATGRDSINYTRAARAFLRRWPDPHAWAAEPLAVRLAVTPSTSPFVMFCMVNRFLRPGYDWLVRRKLAQFWA